MLLLTMEAQQRKSPEFVALTAILIRKELCLLLTNAITDLSGLYSEGYLYAVHLLISQLI